MIDPLPRVTAVLSRATGRIADVPIPRPLRRPLLGPIAGVLGMDLDEAARPLSAFRTLDSLFVRALRPGARAWPAEPGIPASPVDGVVGERGAITGGRLLQAKGREYTVAELLDDVDLAERFGAGAFLTLYLAPRHYHRIHAPVGGTVVCARHVPGRLLPVNAPAVRAIDRLFPRNERVTCVIESDDRGGPLTGAVVVVAVGAFNVGRISARFDEDLVTNRSGAGATTRLYSPPVRVERGGELMAFHLGSTVVVLFERPIPLAPVMEPGREVRVGEALVAGRGEARIESGRRAELP